MRAVEQLPYRPASVALILLTLIIPVAVGQLSGPQWLSFLLGLPVYLLLVWLTYRRLQDAGRSPAWIILMLLVMNIGPRWTGPEPLVFYLGNLLHLVPIVLAWLPPRTVRQQASA